MWYRGGVALLHFPHHDLFRVLSDVGIMALPAFVVFVSEGSKRANCLKNRQKSLVGSDFLRIFARYLCVLRPRVRVLRRGGGLERCELKRE